MVTIYHNPRCSKSRQTLALLEEKGVSIEVKEYLKESPSIEELEGLLKKLKLSAKDVIRTGEAVYKECFKDKDFSEKEWLQAIHHNPILLERPIVVNGKKAAIGRPPENVLSIL